MNYEKEYDTMSESVKKLLENTESKMFKLINDTETKMFELIENYNTKVEESDEYENFSQDEDANNFILVDTVDLSSPFRTLSDYIEDYSN